NSALLIPWTKPPAKRFKEILLPASTAKSRARPMKAERRTALIKSVARGRAWLDEIVSGSAHAATRLRLRSGKRGPRAPGAAGLARPQKHPTHRSIHRTCTGSV